MREYPFSLDALKRPKTSASSGKVRENEKPDLKGEQGKPTLLREYE
jgi:hypothetical protein